MKPTRRVLSAAALALAVAAPQAFAHDVCEVETADICGRTGAVRDAILTAAGASDCAAVRVDAMAGIEALRLESSGLTSLQAGDFAGLDGLRTLNLNGNELTTLPAGVFDALAGLTYLGLHDNALTTLPAGVFDALTALATLNLSNNHLVGLTRDDALFANLPASATVHLGGQTALETVNICDRTAAVRVAILRAAGASDCAAVDADAMAGIESLNLHQRGVRSLKAGDFDALTALATLNLSNNNELTTLPAGVFDELTSLWSLNLGLNALTTLPAGVFDGLTSLQYLYLEGNELTTLPAGVFDGLDGLQRLDLHNNELTTLPAGVFDALGSLTTLRLDGNELTTLPAGVFDGLDGLQRLDLGSNELTTLPAGVFDALGSLTTLDLRYNHLAGLTRDDPLFSNLPANATVHLGGQKWNICDRTAEVRSAIRAQLLNTYYRVRDCAAVDGRGLAGIEALRFSRLTSLAAGDFDGLTGLQELDLQYNALTSLPAGVFDALAGLTYLDLRYNALTSLPAGVFDALGSLTTLRLNGNGLTTLPAGVFDALGSLTTLRLGSNELTTLPAGVFDELTGLQELDLYGNGLTTLPAGVFDALGSLTTLDLSNNHLAGLTRDDPLFSNLPANATVRLDGQTWNVCGRTPKVRDAILTAAGASGCAAVDIVDLAGVERLPIGSKGLTSLQAGDFDGLTNLQELYLFNNALTSLPAGVFDALGSLRELHLEENALTSLPAGVFDELTQLRLLDLHDNALTSLPAGVFDELTQLRFLDLGVNHLVGLTRDDPLFSNLPANATVILGDQTDPPGTARTANVCGRTPQVRDAIMRQASADDCRAVDAAAMAGIAELRLEASGVKSLRAGVFDGLDGLRTLDLSGNRLRTLPAGVFDGLTSLESLDLSDNHLVGLSPSDPVFARLSAAVVVGEQTDGGATRLAAAVPLMLSAAHPSRQGFARIVNESGEAGSVRVFAFDDGGHAPDPIDIPLRAAQTLHFNSNDLEHGNPDKGIEGVGSPVVGDWRLDVESTLPVRVLAFVRTNDGFLTTMHDVLPRGGDGRLVARTFNPGHNPNRKSSLRLVNTGGDDESVSIEGVDDDGARAGPVTLTLAAGESRTVPAADLENGAHGLAGTLGDGEGKWRLLVEAGDSVVAMSLLESAGGHLTSLSTAGAALE